MLSSFAVTLLCAERRTAWRAQSPPRSYTFPSLTLHWQGLRATGGMGLRRVSSSLLCHGGDAEAGQGAAWMQCVRADGKAVFQQCVRAGQLEDRKESTTRKQGRRADAVLPSYRTVDARRAPLPANYPNKLDSSVAGMVCSSCRSFESRDV